MTHLKTPSQLLALLTLLAAPAQAATLRGTPENYRDLLLTLAPGDVLELAAGNYTRGLPISGMSGSAEAPIVITGPSVGPPAVILGRECCNTVSIRDSSYVVIRNLEVDNQGLLVDGVKAESESSFAHHITIENLRIHNFGRDQQLVGISTKCPAWDWVVRNNVIEGAGTGMYFGNSDGSDPFVRGLVEGNLVLEPIGYGAQFKAQIPRPTVPGLPTEPSVTVIRHNVFTKRSGASTGENARPNLLVGAFPPSGPGSMDRHEVYGNFLFENQSGTEPLFQGEGNVAFHDNVLFTRFGPAVFIQNNNGAPRAIDIYSNTVVATGVGVRIVGADGAFLQRVVGNAIFASAPLEGGIVRDNVTGSYQDASRYLVDAAGALETLDLHPRSGMLEGEPLDLSAFVEHVDSDLDFDGVRKSLRMRGAYSSTSPEAAWKLAAERKPLGRENPEMDGGVPLFDGGEVQGDAGTDAGVRPDANQPETTSPDAGRRSESGGTTGGCRCLPDATASAWPLALAGLILILRRRRR